MNHPNQTECYVPYTRHRSNEPFVRRLKRTYPKTRGAKIFAHTVHDMHHVTVNTVIQTGAQYRHERRDIWRLCVFVDRQRKDLIADEMQIVSFAEPRDFP
jgi:hypothetical protein